MQLFTSMIEYCGTSAEYCWYWFDELTLGQKAFLILVLFVIIFIILRIFHWLTQDIHI